MKFRILLAGACAVLGLVGLAEAQSESRYQKTPNGDDMVTYYPKRAMNLGIEGRADIDCMLKPDGTLTDCIATSETPKGYEFGAAAIKLSILFKMRPSEKAMPGSRVQIPINFRLAGNPQSEELAMLARLRWARQPSPEDLENVRPTGLAGEGGVTLRCHVRSGKNLPAQERGTLYDCPIVKEEPGKLGLAKAAQILVPEFQFDGATLPVLPPRYTVDIDVSWASRSTGQASVAH